ncbi:MAG: HIT family protein [Candidatus Bathyarchaeota archaeon]|nr:MAG: HIT family protein [Candidatus Bathyarchaeota archaeon]
MKDECPICRIVVDNDNPFKVCELDTSVVGLNPNQFFRGYTFVTCKKHITELYQLPLDKRLKFCEEMIEVAAAIDKVFHPDKINYELLGNTSPHLHWHIIPRYKNDSLWGQPIWVQPLNEKRLAEKEYLDIIGKIRKNLPISKH